MILIVQSIMDCCRITRSDDQTTFLQILRRMSCRGLSIVSHLCICMYSLSVYLYLCLHVYVFSICDIFIFTIHIFTFMYSLHVFFFRSWAPTHIGGLLQGLLRTGLKDQWVRENLVKTLKDFDRLQPKDPSGQAVATQL